MDPGSGIASTWEPSFEETFTLSLDLQCIGGLDGYFKRVNPAFVQAFGHSSDELLSRPFLDFVHPEDRERSAAALERLTRGLEVTGFENRNLRVDGSILWIEWSARPVPGERLFYGVGRDATDRKLSEERLREAQASMETGRDELRLHVDEQAALRRIATLVARGVSATEILDGVALEATRLLNADLSLMERYEPDGGATILASRGQIASHLPAGTRITLDPETVTERVFRTGRPAGVGHYADVPGHWASVARDGGVRSAVGAPITVEGQLWGVMIVASASEEPLPLDTTERLAEFTELVATAISNAEGRAELQLRSEEQAALRRVATLVARGVSPTEVLDAVAQEAGKLLNADATRVLRYGGKAGVTILASHGEHFPYPPIGVPVPLGEGESVAATVLRTGRPARMEGYEYVSGTVGEMAHELGIRSAVGAPVVVEGHLWGAALALWSGDESPPPDVEARLAAFTELVATAIANAESRAELDASRARIVATADATRRRIERDLHDGAQQQLVSLALETRAAEAVVPPELGELRAELAHVAEGLTDVVDGLREIALGIHPPLLEEGGLGPALKTLARRSPVPVQLDVRVDERSPEPIEVAAYYVVSEAVTNAAKHANASVVFVEVRRKDGALRVSIRDDGVGGADPSRGSGLIGLKDRAEAIGGRISLESAREEGTSLEVKLPLAPPLDEDQQPAADS
jgi:PAS domain S-box-containing protein